MSKELTVSVITASFNRGKFIEKAILSIKNQDYPLIEHIIVDGGSTDNTLDVLKKYDGTYNLKWISEKDEGCFDAYNKGLKMSTGDVICLLDSDDVCLPGTISKALKVFNERSDIDVVFGDLLFQDENDKVIGYTRYLDFNLETLLYFGLDLSGTVTFFRRSVQEKIGYFDKKYLRAGDTDFFVRMGYSGARFFHLREFFTSYRLHKNNLSRSDNIAGIERDEILQKYRNLHSAVASSKWKKNKIRIKRMFRFIKQGDIRYVFMRMLNRLGAYSYE